MCGSQRCHREPEFCFSSGSDFAKCYPIGKVSIRGTANPAGGRIISSRPVFRNSSVWEKATAIHVFCKQEELQGEAFARHWHDLTKLDEAGHSTMAANASAVAESVAAHKTMFFREKDKDGAVIDYGAAVSGELCLVPSDAAAQTLAEDYAHMVSDGLLLDDGVPFRKLLDHCKRIEVLVNDIRNRRRQ